MSQERNWILECWEMSPDSGEEEWRIWSSTMKVDNAQVIGTRLLRKGHKARIRDSHTGRIMELETASECALCGEVHPEPHDGGCLI